MTLGYITKKTLHLFLFYFNKLFLISGTWKSSNLSDEEIKKASNEATNLMQHEASHNTKKAPTTSKGGYCNMLDAVEDFDNDDNRSISNFSTSSLQARKVLKDLDLNKPEGNNTFKVLEKTTTPNFNLRNTGMYFRVY